MAQTLIEVAESLYTVMPRAMALDLLKEYGLEVSAEQARHITKEVLSLSLYWVRSAIHAKLRTDDAERVLAGVEGCIAAGWKDFNMNESEPAAVLHEARSKCADCDRIVREGGSPIAVLGEAAAALEFSGAIGEGDRQKLLALFIDIVPVETFGDLMATVELADS